MKKGLLFMLSLLIGSYWLTASAQDIHISVAKIWDNGMYCAFPSIIKYKNAYYCSFREGEGHVFDKNGKAEGKVRVLKSKDGKKWTSVLLMSKDKYDLRDPKLSITPDGRMMILMGGSIYVDKKFVDCISQVSFSSDGIHFSDPQPVQMTKAAQREKDWLWRMTWDGDTGYVVGYFQPGNGQTNNIHLLKTTDGVHYDQVCDFNITDFPNEATIRILPDKRMMIMVRRDSGDKMGYWGVSAPPYKNWNWTKMGFQLGGPDFVAIDENHIIAGSRSYYISSHAKTSLYLGNIKGDFQEVCTLPSGGDTSYPGLLVVGNELWVCYYSLHETPRASIYLAKMPLNMFLNKK